MPVALVAHYHYGELAGVLLQLVAQCEQCVVERYRGLYDAVIYVQICAFRAVLNLRAQVEGTYAAVPLLAYGEVLRLCRARSEQCSERS